MESPSQIVASKANLTIEENKLKRARSDSDSLKENERYATKKRRVTENTLTLLPKPPIETAEMVSAILFNNEPRDLLTRSIAVALDHVGFDGATQEALESFTAQSESYICQLLSYVTESMLSSRRAFPVPIDFAYALRKDGLDKIGIEPHLKPPVSRLLETSRILEDARDDRIAPLLTKLLGEALDGTSDKQSKTFVPKHFPTFPSKHSYISTEDTPAQESDPRKIRERATEAARYGEEALRRLVKVGKAGQRDMRKAANGDKHYRQRHELWEKAMKALAQSKSTVVDDDAEYGTIVNSEKKFWRKPVVPVKQAMNGESEK